MPLAALSYQEPGIVTILIQASFLLVLNAINWVLDKIIYCGLIGQILIGVCWGIPGANWLSQQVQDAVMQLGYLGLILIVYEGGLSTSVTAVWSNIYLSSSVAMLGICTPIGLSFVLLKLLHATPIQAFAAGAALCSTSLGTTFTILSTSGLEKSRLGIILSSAAMLDDVAGLVMVQVISNLGGSFTATTVIRPVFVSVGFAIVVPVACRFLIGPLIKVCVAKKVVWVLSGGLSVVLTLSIHTLLLVGLVAGASFAGTSNLFAAYIAGAVVTWCDALINTTLEEGNPDIVEEKRTTPSSSSAHDSRVIADSDGTQAIPDSSQSRPRKETTHSKAEETHYPELSGTAIYESFYSPAVTTILKPFFFASIGFSIPITKMFSSAIVWRGIIYTILMIIGKLVCGLVLIRFSPSTRINLPAKTPSIKKKKNKKENKTQEPQQQRANISSKRAPVSKTLKPKSLYPAAMLGSAMVARGEIGFLVSSLAESKGVFGGNEGGGSEIFLVVTWAILLCTVIGPVSVGAMVRRVRRLQKEREGKTGESDPLGGWGIEI